MNDMKKSRFTAGFFVSLFLTLFLAGIIVFWLFGHLKIHTFEPFIPVLIFSAVNILLLLVIFGAGKLFSGKIGIPHYIAVIISTVIYSVVQFLFTAANYKLSGVTTRYILTELIFLFVYCAVIMPTAISGSKKQK